MLRVGLTGGVASGKSTVARMFEELGAGLVDTDVIAREMVAPGSAGLKAVSDSFGPDILEPGGALDRAAMRRRVFADPAARRQLEAILHPLIRSETLRQLDAMTAPYAIVAVPLLIETGFAALVDRILVVDCPEALQRERLETRDRITSAEADAMMQAQLSRQARLAAADDVIDNSGDLDSTRQQVRNLHRRYLDLQEVCRAQRSPAE
jgi:dephospho-CoA kinase